jgi:hypothetical protein
LITTDHWRPVNPAIRTHFDKDAIHFHGDLAEILPKINFPRLAATVSHGFLLLFSTSQNTSLIKDDAVIGRKNEEPNMQQSNNPEERFRSGFSRLEVMSTRQSDLRQQHSLLRRTQEAIGAAQRRRGKS